VCIVSGCRPYAYGPMSLRMPLTWSDMDPPSKGGRWFETHSVLVGLTWSRIDWLSEGGSKVTAS
jgi:hypothetical protein